jgi:hypothetical protein
MSKSLDSVKAAATGGKYSENEIEDFVNLEKRLASKPVLTSVMEVIREGPEKGLDAKEAERICERITSLMPYPDTAYVSVSFTETDFSLGLSLTIVDKNYRTDIDLPHQDYVRDTYDKYDLLKQCASAYWTKFCFDNKDLFNRIADYRKDVDFSVLHMDPENPTTLYFDPESRRRIGIGGFYIGTDNKIYFKKRK